MEGRHRRTPRPCGRHRVAGPALTSSLAARNEPLTWSTPQS